jgi:ectoine hydroxylase-related dioxygenase (phytanoyl-CoA dioxygenase family)
MDDNRITDHEFHKNNLATEGFTIIDQIFSVEETELIIQEINSIQTTSPLLRKSGELFAIRQFIKLMPQVKQFIFTQSFLDLIIKLIGRDYFIVKSIYFDKPENSNWFVAYHQDLTISVQQKNEVAGFRHWTVKHDQYSVQPPVSILENNYTLRIHLDHTDAQNGALKVIRGSHKNPNINKSINSQYMKEEIICPVQQGGIMIMKPLLMHASSKSLNGKQRRVIHLELSNCDLPEKLSWSEFDLLPFPK